MSRFFDEVDTSIEEQQDHTLWCEKYRPTTLENYIGNETIKARVANYIATNDVPHLLLHGKAGTGKTSLAKLIVKNTDCDYLYINASDENSVDTIRNKIRSFASSVGFKSIKVIILDEADFLSLNALAALRNIMETFSQHTRFILTCNYKEKISDPIQSRCQSFLIVPPSRKEVAIHLAQILTNEGISYDPSDIKLIVDSTYPDLRRCINSAQLQSRKGKLKIDKQSVIESDYKLKVLQILSGGSDGKEAFKMVRKTVADSRVQDFSDCYQYLYDNLDDFASGHIAKAILILAEAEYKDAFVVDHEINFMSCMVQLISEVK